MTRRFASFALCTATVAGAIAITLAGPPDTPTSPAEAGVSASTTAAASRTPATNPTSSPACTPRPYLFGINPVSGTGVGVGAWLDEYSWRAMRFVGATCTRMGASWHFIERARGTYDWESTDDELAALERAGIEPFCLVCNTPPWALAPGKQPHAWPPEPQFMPDFERFCRTLAERYRGRIRSFEFWNESNGFGWHAVNHPDDYAPLLRAGYRALKQGNPDCLVAVGGLDGAGWKGYYKYLDRLYALGCGDSFDAVAVHPYNHQGPIDADGLRAIRAVLLSHDDGHKPLWVTEYGWDNAHPIEARARWLKESLDILSDPEFAYVTQSSYHTIIDFDATEYGLCAAPLRPRLTYHVFYNYRHGRLPPVVAAARTHEATDRTRLPLRNGDFETTGAWTPFGRTDAIVAVEAAPPVRPAGRGFGAVHTGAPKCGGAWQRVRAQRGELVRASVRIRTNDPAGHNDTATARIGIDPRGGNDPAAPTIRWSRWEHTDGAWATFQIGQIEPIVAAGNAVTVFLEHRQTGATTGQTTVFDDASAWSYPREWIDVPTTSPAGDDLLASFLPRDATPAATSAYAECPVWVASDFGDAQAMKAWKPQKGTWDVRSGGYALLAAPPGDAAYDKPLPPGHWAIEADVLASRALNAVLWVDLGEARRVALAVSNWSARRNVALLDTTPRRVVHPFDDEAIADKSGATLFSRSLSPPIRVRLRLERRGDAVHGALDERPIGVIRVGNATATRFGVAQPQPGSGVFERIVVYQTAK